jgi:hypothetical protein
VGAKSHHDGGQEGRHLPRLDRVVEIVLVIVVWFLRSIGIRAHTVARAVGSMSTQVVRARCDAVAVAGAGWTLLFSILLVTRGLLD